ncbi:MAG: tryptophan halogenase [Sphingomonas bacterium]|uniref:tryptophan halogenase family protein n=1 Tax=Sphingomonas bacterium TaxID=1895847 RepID=UPI002624AFD6|nr:tryptophan halogenase family protein [Sphingomonas bacterium]MDB5703409.1 tryptophan halogenase [Sphingomonas bacterium]
MDRPARLRSIVVVGGGVTGWMAAAALAPFTRSGMRVTLIDCAVDEVGAQATLPAHRDFHTLMGIDEHDMLASAGGTMRLGAGFTDPVRRAAYVHAFGDFGLEVGGVAFYQLWLRAHAAGQGIDLDDYSLAAIAAKMGRFARPAADKRAMMDYGYHLETAAYAAYLRSQALAQGVACEAGEIASVALDSESGLIAAVVLHDGRSIPGDFFVDCSGARAALIGGALGEPFEDWSAWFPCDREVRAESAVLADLPPLTTVSAYGSGWQRRLPLQRMTWHGRSFIAGETSDDAALAGQNIINEPRFAALRAGKRRRLWARNCAAIGAAGVSIEPIEAGELDLAHVGILALLSLMPDRDGSMVEADEFERRMTGEIQELRDLTLLHRVSMEGDKPILRVAGEIVPLPDSLAHRVELFRGRGRLQPRDNAAFGPADWLAVLLGRAILPVSWDPLADAIDVPRAQQNFLRLAGLFRQSAETMPGHAAYIARHCAAMSRAD